MSAENTRRIRNRSASVVDDDTNSFAATGPVISVSACSGGVMKVTPSPSASKVTLRLAGERGLDQREVRRVEIELGPLGARNRPFILGALDERLAWMAHLQQHARLLAPAGVLALQEIVEELALQLAAVVGVEMRPVLDAVRLEPFVLRGGARKALEIAARVQALSAPVRRREQRRGDLVPLGRARLVIVVVERMRADFRAEVAAVLRELFFAQASPARTPVRRARVLRLPRSPAPYCTVFTCMSYQLAQKVESMPP